LEKAEVVQETVKFLGENGTSIGVLRAMSETAEAQSKPASTRGNSSDKQAFAQVEKWMAMIREISREWQAPAKLHG